MARKALGRGLGALLSAEGTATATEDPNTIAIDLIDPTSGDRVLPGILEGDEPPDLPASTYRWFPVGNWPRWPRWPRF